MDRRPLSHVLEHVGIHPEARFVFFFTFDDWWDSIDMDDARHPQTLLAYAMNGPEMPLDHGAPLRLKVPRQLGYKNLKYLARMTVTDTRQGNRRRTGLGAPVGRLLLVRGNLRLGRDRGRARRRCQSARSRASDAGTRCSSER